MLGSQISFNLGNAIGAFVGGIPITYGFGYEYTVVPGVIFSFIGYLLLICFYNRYKAA